MGRYRPRFIFTRLLFGMPSNVGQPSLVCGNASLVCGFASLLCGMARFARGL